MARSKLTKDRLNLAIQLVERGFKKENIYGALGVARSTYWKWYSWGERVSKLDPKTLTAEDKRYKKFYEEIEKAESRAIMKFQENMMREGEGDWKMWRELLKVIDQQGWGEKKEIEFEGKNGMEIVIKKVDASVRNDDARNRSEQQDL